ncbi:helix-turn-helix domain-containing protein [Actinomadura fibrosa]|uniref:Helix-turn-helix domain-containing protein n=1 Tax=Actinomadura fibrosa TaxID=111802 RepID=A0ABW2XBK6_9ACTN|nr:helix-turn-helix transcriptional regulator [Actinomadura fibrosa]
MSTLGDMAKRPPTVRIKRLGVQLRKLREERDLTLDQAAALLMISKSALNRMENAQVITRAHEVTYILMMYGVSESDDLWTSMIGLASAGRSRDWVKRHAAVGAASRANEFIRLEQDSRAVRAYEPLLVPGLLQTADYTRAVMQSVSPLPGVDIDQAVEYRMARKDALTRQNPLKLDVVLGDTALRQRLGGRAVMRAQLMHVVDAMDCDNINVQVFPTGTVKHPGLDGAFTMLDVEMGDFTVVLIDSRTRSICIEDEEEVEPYRQTFRDLQELAYPPTESRQIIKRAAEEFDDVSNDDDSRGAMA